jgi:hypothetical protein
MDAKCVAAAARQSVPIESGLALRRVDRTDRTDRSDQFDPSDRSDPSDQFVPMENGLALHQPPACQTLSAR